MAVGIRALTLGTRALRVGDSLSVPIRHTSAERQMGLTGPGPVAEKPVSGFIEAEIFLDGLTVAQIVGEYDVAQVDYLDGRSYVLKLPRLEGDPADYNGATGRVTLRWTGEGQWVE